MNVKSIYKKIKKALCLICTVVIIISCESYPVSEKETDIGDTEVWIEESKFKPFHKYVNLGQSVRWVNKDSKKHTVTSGLPGNESSRVFDSGVLEPGDTFTVDFPKKRQAHKYYCKIHGVDYDNPPVVRIRETYQK